MRFSGLKKVLAILIVLTVIFSAVQTAFAETGSGIFDVGTPSDIGTSGDASTPSDAGTSSDADKVIARLSVCSTMPIPPLLGHMFLYVENLSDKPIQVGLYELSVGQGVSIGTFSLTVWDGWGIYYNVEAFRENKKDREDILWAKSADITEEDLGVLSKRITGYFNYWDLFFNCTFFAYTTWNRVTGGFLVPLLFPVLSHLVVMIAGGEKGTLDMYYPEGNQVFRQRGYGDSAYLEPVRQATLDE